MVGQYEEPRWHRYFAKWVSISVLIGIVCGLSALALLAAVRAVSALMLGVIAGYNPPLAGGEGGTPTVTTGTIYLIPLVTGLGGLIVGLLIHFLAPEAAGVGTDAAIKAFHKEGAIIRARIPLLKLLTSAITIGSGGTSGREGPIAQIGAGAGSTISRLLKLDKRSREIALAAGLGAGIASIFKAPLAGAIISAEIFYTHDFEVEALIPGFVASVVGYSIVGYAVGWQPIFTTSVSPIEFRNPLSLPLYSLLGALCALFTRALIRVYYPITSAFNHWKVPFYFKTTTGGLATGLVGMFVPSVLGTGYGWAQIALNQNYALFPPLLILAAVIAEIFSLSFTLGSGGSGGVFGPSIVTGGLLGAFTGFLFAHAFPSIAPNPADFALVGMIAFFAAAGKAPISTIVLVAEMSGGYGLLAPAMFAVVPAFLLSSSKSIFPSQLRTRFESPAHSDEFEALELERTSVSDIMTTEVITVSADSKVVEALELMSQHSVEALPVLDAQQRLAGIVTRDDLFKVGEEERRNVTIREIMTPKVVTCHPEDDLYAALKPMIVMDIESLPVVSQEDPRKLVGIVMRSDIGAVIERKKPAMPARG